MVFGVVGVGLGSFFGQGFNICGFGVVSNVVFEVGIVQLIDGEKKYYEFYCQGVLFVEFDFLCQVEVLCGLGFFMLYGLGVLGGVIVMEMIELGDLIFDGKIFGGKVKLGYVLNFEIIFGSVVMGWCLVDDFEVLVVFVWCKLGDSQDVDGNIIVCLNLKMLNLFLKVKKIFGDQYVVFFYQYFEVKGMDQDFNQLEGG